MTGPITIEMIVGFFAVASAVGGLWWKIEARETKVKEKAVELASNLAEYKTHVAETYVSKQGLREVRDEIMSGVRDLKVAMENTALRIDRMNEVASERSRKANS